MERKKERKKRTEKARPPDKLSRPEGAPCRPSIKGRTSRPCLA